MIKPTVKLTPRGNSLAVTLPKDILDASTPIQARFRVETLWSWKQQARQS